MDGSEMMPVELPHGGRMRWVREAALQPDGRTTLVRAEINADHPFVRAGYLLPAALVEWMAQTAAAGSALAAAARGERVGRGLLAAIQEWSVHRAVPAGSRVEFRGTHERSFGALAQSRFEARMDGELVAEGRMTFHVTLE